MFIELARGETVNQPMFKRTVFENELLPTLRLAEEFCKIFRLKGFETKRLKVEIPAASEMMLKIKDSSANYFEWHGQVEFKEIGKLKELCSAHGAHLSRNSLKNEVSTRFITLREFDEFETFEKRIKLLVADLDRGGWAVLKQQSEYCLYDTNISMDNGWLKEEER